MNNSYKLFPQIFENIINNIKFVLNIYKMSDQEFVDLKQLNNRIDELIGTYRILKENNTELRTLNEELKRALQERSEEMKELEKKYDRIKLTGAILGNEENSIEAKRRITDLMREIDKCIALLDR